MSGNDRSMFQMQQKATLPPNAFLAEFPPSLYSQDNSAQGIRINTDIGWEQRPDDQYHLHVWKEFEGAWQLTSSRDLPLKGMGNTPFKYSSRKFSSVGMKAIIINSFLNRGCYY